MTSKGRASSSDTQIAAYLSRLGPYTEDELANMRAKGICPCGVEDAVRYPHLRAGRSTVPTSANCPSHMEEWRRLGFAS